MGGKCDNKEPYFNIAIIQTPMFEWYIVRCRSKNGNYATYSRFNSQHNLCWGGRGPICPLNEQENLHFDNELIVQAICKNYEANSYGHYLGCLIILH